MSSVRYPLGILRNMNSRSIDTPVTISAFIMGMYVILSTMFCVVFLHSLMPIAARVPMTVDIIDDRNAIDRVFVSASATFLSWNSCPYHYSENPVHLLIVFPSLNEYIMSMMIGI